MVDKENTIYALYVWSRGLRDLIPAVKLIARALLALLVH